MLEGFDFYIVKTQELEILRYSRQKYMIFFITSPPGSPWLESSQAIDVGNANVQNMQSNIPSPVTKLQVAMCCWNFFTVAY